MTFSADFFLLLWEQLFWPLIRLLGFVSLGLMVANIVESLNWTSKFALLARPMIRFGKMSETAGASFSMALFSAVSANSMLSEAYEKKQLSKKELILANLFNSLPTYFLHLPTIFFITVPLIKGAAFIYVGMTFLAALLRTLTIVVLSRFLLRPSQSDGASVPPVLPEHKKLSWQEIFAKSGKRFKRRIKKIVVFTIPIYIAIFLFNRHGGFDYLESIMADYLYFAPWLSPQSISIITLHLAAEITASIAAAGALLQDGNMTYREIVLALMVGNVLSSPLRAIRHQFPYYAGIFKPALALQLICFSQSFRILSLLFVGVVYFFITA